MTRRFVEIDVLKVLGIVAVLIALTPLLARDPRGALAPLVCLLAALR